MGVRNLESRKTSHVLYTAPGFPVGYLLSLRRRPERVMRCYEA